MTGARDAVRRAREAVERAADCREGDALAEALSSATDALNAAATALEHRTERHTSRSLHAAWYVRDAASVLWDATERQRHVNGGGRDPVRYAVALLPLEIARRALSAAMTAVDEADALSQPQEADA